MKRLTKKDNGYYGLSDTFRPESETEHIEALQDKLGKLEDLEAELGIDLITLFKALKNEVYYKTKELSIEHSDIFDFNYWKYTILIRNGIILDLCGYGKAWALTREELE